MSKYSIVIPCLNEERYVGKILQCLADQTFKDFDVTVVDGNSEDRTIQVAESFKDRLDLRVLIAEARGPSSQRNLGAKDSESEYVLFFDADTFVLHTFLEDLDKKLTEKDPDVFTCWNWPLTNRAIDGFMYFLFFQFYMELVKSFRPGAVGIFMGFKRSVFNEIGMFDESIVVAEDYEIYHRAHRKGFKYMLTKKPCVWTSIRRFEKEGRLKFYLKTVYAEIYTLFKGPIRDTNVLNWEFGDFD